MNSLVLALLRLAGNSDRDKLAHRFVLLRDKSRAKHSLYKEHEPDYRALVNHQHQMPARQDLVRNHRTIQLALDQLDVLRPKRPRLQAYDRRHQMMARTPLDLVASKTVSAQQTDAVDWVVE
jgi:hypothetical protein